MLERGTCEKHGEFILTEGCPGCLVERPVPEIIIVCSGGCGRTTEGMTMETRQGDFRQVDESGVPEWTCPDCLAKKSQQPEPEPEIALALRPGEDIEVHGYFKEALKLLEYAEGRVIATVEDVKVATDDLSIISRLKKAMEEKKREYLDPLKAEAEAIRETYSSLMDPVFRADKITRDKMLAYDAEQKRIRAEQEAINQMRTEAAEKEAALHNGEITESVNLVEVSPEAPKHVSTDMGTAGQTDHWKYEVFDFALLPDEYKIADSAMLNSVAKRHHDQKQIPGVRFYNEPYIAVRTK